MRGESLSYFHSQIRHPHAGYSRMPIGVLGDEILKSAL